MGVPNANTLSDGVASPPPAAPPVPAGVTITKTGETSQTSGMYQPTPTSENNFIQVDALGNPTGF